MLNRGLPLSLICGLVLVTLPMSAAEWRKSYRVSGQPELRASLHNTTYMSTFHVTVLLFFTAAVAMPHMFYMTFSENYSFNGLRFASWGLPLYFLLLSIPVLPILWAGLNIGSPEPVEYFPVVIGNLQ